MKPSKRPPWKKSMLQSLDLSSIVDYLCEISDNGVFVNNHALYLENRFCPQCGAPRKIVEVIFDDSSD